METQGQPVGMGSCIIKKVTTTVDGGANVTLDFAQHDFPLIEQLLKIKMQNDQVLQVVFVKVDD